MELKISVNLTSYIALNQIQYMTLVQLFKVLGMIVLYIRLLKDMSNW